MKSPGCASRHIKCLIVNLFLGLIFLSGFYHAKNKSFLILKSHGELLIPSMPCRAKTNVMFLKTHKTASSTLLNVMFRFAERYNLTVALPAAHHVHLGYPKTFLAHFVEAFQAIGQNYNIMCNHLRFNPSEVQKVMAANTFYFSILRNPISLLESSYTYYKDTVPAFRLSKDVNEYLASPMKYYHPEDSKKNIYARNIMWFDFGYDNNAQDNKKYVQAVLKEIEQNFHLILIAEYFDESMILLKHVLCWDLDDVIYFKLNSRSQDTVQTLTLESKERIKVWCSLDWQLYLHFNQSFWRTIEETIGLKKLEKEVNHLRMRQKELMETCLSDQKAVEKDRIQNKALLPFQSGAANILGYNLRQDLDNRTLRTCQRMVMPELQYTSYLYAVQHPHKKRKPFGLSLPAFQEKKTQIPPPN
ncbi:galactose-3-O-sulfotransferase 2 isoform X1 [Columba livia]|uniref:Galactose-3-O-sulfotransferase 2 n=1 Tax=Columba livia TaxID=8932 RepID=A0A2I0LUV2_COLLI|nr:galactose-3-O-sulfotransferase 2 isoform X1 [Columba livia]KAK2538701.1 Gal3st2 [Columba livia]PKK21204.1 galactose-3-O-sulfotransferase 2 [Columba livia]